MDAERQGKIRRLFEKALSRPPLERRAYLEQACAGDSSLLEEVASLILEHEEDADFLASPLTDRAFELMGLDENGPDEEPAWPSPIGSTFAGYEILEKLGEGGMGEVYLARGQNETRVALKLISPAQRKNPLLRKRFLREARAASGLDHPGICPILKHGRFRDREFIAMEHVEGVTLEKEMSGEPLSTGKIVHIVRQIAEVLEYAHGRGVIHRDLKPSNIMLTSSGVKLLDFGLAKLIPDAEGVVPETMTQLTIEGSAIGTLSYMSPEQLRGQTVDARTDIFSLGVILYEMLAGKHPFRRVSRLHTASAILSETQPPLIRQLQDVPQPLNYLVGKMLEKDPVRRPASMKRVLADLALPTNRDYRDESPLGRLFRFLRRRG